MKIFKNVECSKEFVDRVMPKTLAP